MIRIPSLNALRALAGRGLRRLGGTALLLVLAACGGGGSGGAEPAAVARVEITPGGLLLSGSGQQKALTATAYDATGNPVAATVSWVSSAPAVVGVDAQGMATAAAGSGLAQITASAGGISSPPVTAVVAALAPGAQALSDAQIVGEPVDHDSSSDDAFQITLAGSNAPAVGTLLVSTETKAVAGRVTATAASGSNTLVTLTAVSLREAFPTLELDTTLDLSTGSISVPADIAAAYTVARSGNTYTFTPKGGATGSSTGRSRALAATGVTALPPFTTCESSTTLAEENSPLPLTVTAPPVFSISIVPTLDIKTSASEGLQRLKLNAAPTIKVEGGLAVAAAFEAKYGCKVELMALPIPAGPLGAFFGGVVPIGVGFEIGGKLTLAQMALSTKVEVTGTLGVGYDCVAGNCSFGGTMNFKAPTPTYTVRKPSGADQRVDLGLEMYGWADVAIGNAWLKKLRFTALGLKAGGKLAGSFAPQITQVLDTNYKSDYKLTLEAGAKMGESLTGLAKLFGLGSITGAELVLTKDLLTSPAATSVKASADTWQTGETATITVQLSSESANTTLPDGSVFYNVDHVLLIDSSTGEAVQVATTVANPGQLEFSFTVDDKTRQASKFSAFVVTKLLPLDLLALELGQAQVPKVEVRSVKAGSMHTCITTPAGGVKCWGAGVSGQLGQGLQASSATPVDALVLGSAATAVSAAGDYACAVTAAGGLQCWGRTPAVQVATQIDIRADEASQTSGVAAVDAGPNHSCLLTSSGGVKCWGFNPYGELGNGSTPNANTGAPAGVRDVVGLSSGVQAVSSGSNHTCALTTAGGVKCWGYGELGQLGNGAKANSGVPVDVIGLGSGVVALAAGYYHTCAITAAGGMKCWGDNDHGQLGNGQVDLQGSAVPVDVAGLGGTVAAVGAGVFHTCALMVDGTVKCWGNSIDGQLGSVASDSAIPVAIAGLKGPGRVLVVGNRHNCVGDAAGAFQCWGSGGAGQLGQGAFANSRTPVNVVGLP